MSLLILRGTGATVLVVTPNLTVRERLAELDPENGEGLYGTLVPPNLQLPTGRIHVTILNFQAFQRRSELAINGSADVPSRIAKRLISPHGEGEPANWTEDHSKMLRRLLPSHRGAKEIIVLNDEAHHCYRPETILLREKNETIKREESSALWFSALRALQEQGILGQVFDLSATPMYLKRPALLDHELFPWTVSDYPLIDAVEAGLTKIPRVPVSDNAEPDLDDPLPIYRDTYNNVTPKKIDPDNVQPLIKNLLDHMHNDYNELDTKYKEAGITPVMIVVANTVRNANAFYKHIAGWCEERIIKDPKTGNKTILKDWKPGVYRRFSNVKDDATGPVEHPLTLLIHSGIDDTDEEGTGADKVAEIQKEFFSPQGSSITKAARKAYIRKAFNTVGKKGEPGEHVRCIISVSMLTEGWDVRTVTHIFGFRAFTSQLLCEQVAGRALRRTSFPIEGNKLLPPEYARIFGVPFSFMRGDGEDPIPTPVQTWPVYTVEGKSQYRIMFPNIAAYTLEPPSNACKLDLDKVKLYPVIRARVPTETYAMGAVGEEQIIKTGKKRRNEILYGIAARAIDHFFSYKKQDSLRTFARRRVLFASMLEAVRQWLEHPDVKCEDISMLAYPPHAENVPLAIAEACDEIEDNSPRIHPVFADECDPNQQRLLDTSNVAFETSLRHRYPTSSGQIAEHCELSAAACHSHSETLLASALDHNEKIVAWARNFRLGWQIPYLDRRNGSWRFYEPDFIARLDGDKKKPRHLIIEFKGQPSEDSEQKTTAVREWWIPAVNGSDDPTCEGFWQYVFIDDEKNIDQVLATAIQRTFSDGGN